MPLTDSMPAASGPVRPAGTRAFLFAMLSLVAAFALWVVVMLVGALGVSPFGVAWGPFVAAVCVVPAIVTGIIQRLVGARRERVQLSRVAAWAFGVPFAVAVLGSVVDAL